MPHSNLALVLAGLATSITLLAGLLLFIYREARRVIALDRRLSAPRRQALALGLWSQHRERRGSGVRGEARAFGLALVKAGSILAPVGAAEREKLAQMVRQAGFGHSDALSLFLSLKLGAALGEPSPSAADHHWTLGARDQVHRAVNVTRVRTRLRSLDAPARQWGVGVGPRGELVDWDA